MWIIFPKFVTPTVFYHHRLIRDLPGNTRVCICVCFYMSAQHNKHQSSLLHKGILSVCLSVCLFVCCPLATALFFKLEMSGFRKNVLNTSYPVRIQATVFRNLGWKSVGFLSLVHVIQHIKKQLLGVVFCLMQ